LYQRLSLYWQTGRLNRKQLWKQLGLKVIRYEGAPSWRLRGIASKIRMKGLKKPSDLHPTEQRFIRVLAGQRKMEVVDLWHMVGIVTNQYQSYEYKIEEFKKLMQEQGVTTWAQLRRNELLRSELNRLISWMWFVDAENIYDRIRTDIGVGASGMFKRTPDNIDTVVDYYNSMGQNAKAAAREMRQDLGWKIAKSTVLRIVRQYPHGWQPPQESRERIEQAVKAFRAYGSSVRASRMLRGAFDWPDMTPAKVKEINKIFGDTVEPLEGPTLENKKIKRPKP
jgi:hypothetical protein